MNKKYIPYYISRAILSSIFAILIAGFSWIAIIIALVLFGFFLLYLHSGWFKVEDENPFFPLRRDAHAQDIQRKALILAVFVGFAAYFGLSLLSSQLDLSIAFRSIALPMAVIVYFATQFWLFSRA